MRFPPRLSHLATRAVVTAKLAPVYALAHGIEDDEARIRLDRALAGPLLDELLAAAWSSLTGDTKRLDDSGLLEKVAKSLQDRPLRPGRPPKDLGREWSAFLLTVDLAAGTASDSAARVLEREEAQQMAARGLVLAGEHLAKELVRK